MFKKAIAIIMSFALVITGINFMTGETKAAVTSSSGSSSWKLVWNDEFNQTVGSAPDSSNWSYDIGYGPNGDGWGNLERQYYTDSTNNVYIADMSSDAQSSDGRCLAIKAQREGDVITSGRIHSQNKVYARYGKIEAKLRVEKGQQSGVWPAFWMLGENYVTSGNNWNGANGESPWPSSGEIDIMEHRNAETDIIGTLHWNPSTTAYQHIYAGSETTGSFGTVGSIEEWHRYSIEWYGDVIKWYVDDVCYQTINITSSEMDEFQRSHFLLLNLAIGSTSTPFTKYQTISDSFTDATMYVDYVRVYQGTDADFYVSKTTDGETAAEPTTVGDGYTTCTTDSNVNVGQWNYYAGTWAGVSARYKGGENLDDFSLKVLANNGGDWGLQAFTNEIAVTAGHTYRYSITLNSDTDGASVLLKDEKADTELETKTLVAGDNIYTGTYVPSENNIQFMFNLSGVTAGTTVNFTNVTLTDITEGSEVITTTAEETEDSGEDTWQAIDGSTVFTYGNVNNMSVVNVQQPGWADETGIYIYTSQGIGYITLNGAGAGTESAAIDGAGAVIYLSALTAETTNVSYYTDDGTLIGSVDIKNSSVTGTDETVTEAPTTTEEPTTTTAVSEAEPIYPIGLNPTSGEAGKLTIVWGQTAEMIESGQKYNVYVDDIQVLANVDCGSYTIDATPGEHTVSMEAVLGDKVSERLTASVVVMGTEASSESTETTTEDVSVITVSESVKVEGFQISTSYEGSRVVGSVEPTIDGKNVSNWGFVYGLAVINGNSTNISDSDMKVGADNEYVVSYQSTPVGTMDVILGASDTATYFARTMSFGKKSVSAFTAVYKVRAYALMEDGTYLYSDVAEYSVYSIADHLYQNHQFNTMNAHNYAYDTILKKVDPNYIELDYTWSNSIIKPNAIN